MKAIRNDRYGLPDVLELWDIEMPVVGDDEVLVRVRAAPVNPLDWHFMRDAPYLVRMVAGLSRLRASAGRLGAAMAGSVEAVGTNVTRFRPGDEVFGGLEGRGTLAEYISIREDGVVLNKPASLTFEQAASVPWRASPLAGNARQEAHPAPGTRCCSTARPGWGRSRCRSPTRSAPR
jgi:NADPH:quinone reductase-like Zn-dependent oxidoreductase